MDNHLFRHDDHDCTAASRCACRLLQPPSELGVATCILTSISVSSLVLEAAGAAAAPSLTKALRAAAAEAGSVCSAASCLRSTSARAAPKPCTQNDCSFNNHIQAHERRRPLHLFRNSFRTDFRIGSARRKTQQDAPAEWRPFAHGRRRLRRQPQSRPARCAGDLPPPAAAALRRAPPAAAAPHRRRLTAG